VTGTELAEFASSVYATKDGYVTDLGIRISGEDHPSHPEICEPLSRLTSAQIRAVIDAWPAQPSPGEERGSRIQNFLRLAGRVNPAATVPLIYELLTEPKGIRMPDWAVEEPFRHWLRHDPEGLLQWAQQAGMPEGYKGQCAMWADAALVVRDSSVENLRRLLGHQAIYFPPSSEVILKFQTPEARLKFFQNLHAATDGVYDDLREFVRPLAARIPFAQLAYMADATPHFKRSGREHKGLYGQPEERGSLRFEVALDSRDGTAAQRWEWLTQRPEDHPSDNAFQQLVDAWCKNDYGDTASWIRSLPPGSDRDTGKKKVIAYLETHGGGDFLSEWKSP
jgi:hypothetical protein